MVPTLRFVAGGYVPKWYIRGEREFVDLQTHALRATGCIRAFGMGFPTTWERRLEQLNRL